MRTILLSGASGFLGSNLTKSLCKNYHIIALVRSTSNLAKISHLPIKIYNIDKVKLEAIFTKHRPQIIIHTAVCYGRAGEPLSHLAQTNLIFSLRLLELAVQFGAKIFINTDTLQHDNLSSYTISKKTLRDYLPHFSDNLNLINCRIEHIYGIGDGENKFIANLLSAFWRDIPRIPLTHGRQMRDFVYIDDVVSAYQIILDSAVKNPKNALQCYDIGSGDFVSVREFVEVLLAECKKYKNISTMLDFGAIPYNDIGEISENLAPLINLGFRAKYPYKLGIAILAKDYFAKSAESSGNIADSALDSAICAQNRKNPNWGGAERDESKTIIAIFAESGAVFVDSATHLKNTKSKPALSKAVA